MSDERSGLPPDVAALLRAERGAVDGEVSRETRERGLARLEVALGLGTAAVATAAGTAAVSSTGGTAAGAGSTGGTAAVASSTGGTAAGAGTVAAAGAVVKPVVIAISLVLAVSGGAAMFRAVRPAAVAPDEPVAESLPEDAGAPAPVVTPLPDASPTVIPDDVADAGSLVAPVRRRHAAPPAPAGLADERVFLERARAALADGDTSTALSGLGEHGARFPHGQLTEEREALTVLALARDADPAARPRAARFLRRFPESLYRAAVEQVLATPDEGGR